MMSDLKANSMYWYNSLMFIVIVLYSHNFRQKKYLYSLYWFQNWILVIIQLEGLISCQASHYSIWTSYQMPSKLFYKQVQQTRWNQQFSNIVEEITHIQIRPRIILKKKEVIRACKMTLWCQMNKTMSLKWKGEQTYRDS